MAVLSPRGKSCIVSGLKYFSQADSFTPHIMKQMLQRYLLQFYLSFCHMMMNFSHKDREMKEHFSFIQSDEKALLPYIIHRLSQWPFSTVTQRILLQ